jgi:NADH-quinone oxidoreductase subunit I
MNGLGIIKGLWTTFRHLLLTYIVDLRQGKKRYNTAEGISARSAPDVEGAFTVQYPEEKLPVPEEFRFIPMLIYISDSNGDRKYRCTACGICSKVCPPQCISITRSSDPVTDKPISSPAMFFIDIDICMNCGSCAEYCPFDAIKMDHNYEIASSERIQSHILDKNALGKPIEYYASIRPTNYNSEEIERNAKASKKVDAATS